jgi:DNA-binding response OmpR family regulator
MSSDPQSQTLGLLVVDDDPAWRDALRPWLEAEGFRVVMLARGEWVVPAIELHQPDVVVLDVELPGASGLEVLDTLGRRWRTLPVIIMTAFGGPAVANAAREHGAAGYLEKPFRIGALVNEIRRVARGDADIRAANG